MILAGIIEEPWQQVSSTQTLILHTILGLAARTIRRVTRAAMVRLEFYDLVGMRQIALEGSCSRELREGGSDVIVTTMKAMVLSVPESIV